MLRIAVVGTGDWGKNFIRVLQRLKDVELSYCCDADPRCRQMTSQNHPDIEVTDSVEDIMANTSIDALIISSSAVSHYPLAKAALEAGKHVFVEKPLALQTAHAEEILQLAEKNKRTLMVGHLLLYHPAVSYLKKLVDSGELGEILYMYSQRVNLGKIRQDENALWSFAPHDISVILHLFEEMPLSVSARGESYLREGVEDVVFINMKFPKRKMAQIQVSWLDPHKVRKITVVGSKKMAVFDDTESVEKLKIFDKGVTGVSYDSYGDSITIRFGDIKIPHISMTEPLRAECQHFVECILEDRRPLSDGRDGVRVVSILEAAQQSMKNDGTPIQLTEHLQAERK